MGALIIKLSVNFLWETWSHPEIIIKYDFAGEDGYFCSCPSGDPI